VQLKETQEDKLENVSRNRMWKEAFSGSIAVNISSTPLCEFEKENLNLKTQAGVVASL
jgi:hypothetical protein